MTFAVQVLRFVAAALGARDDMGGIGAGLPARADGITGDDERTDGQPLRRGIPALLARASGLVISLPPDGLPVFRAVVAEVPAAVGGVAGARPLRRPGRQRARLGSWSGCGTLRGTTNGGSGRGLRFFGFRFIALPSRAHAAAPAPDPA